jgi:hypothetical protein
MSEPLILVIALIKMILRELYSSKSFNQANQGSDKKEEFFYWIYCKFWMPNDLDGKTGLKCQPKLRFIGLKDERIKSIYFLILKSLNPTNSNSDKKNTFFKII